MLCTFFKIKYENLQSLTSMENKQMWLIKKNCYIITYPAAEPSRLKITIGDLIDPRSSFFLVPSYCTVF